MKRNMFAMFPFTFHRLYLFRIEEKSFIHDRACQKPSSMQLIIKPLAIVYLAIWPFLYTLSRSFAFKERALIVSAIFL